MRLSRKPLPLTVLFVIAAALAPGCGRENPVVTRQITEQPPAPTPWVRTLGSSAYDESHDVAVDGVGNVFVVGAANADVDFGSVTFDQSKGPVFLAKYNPIGEFLWVKQVSGAGPDGPLRLGTDNTGSVCLQGVFASKLTIDGNVIPTGGGADHVFVARFDAAGNLLWVKHDEGSYLSVGFGMNTGETGATAVTGFIQTGATFGDTELAVQGFDYFIVAYNANGDVLWATQSGSDNRAIGAEVAVDPSNNVVVAGEFRDTVTFGDVELTSAGSRDGFVAKFGADGDVVWAIQIGGGADGAPSAVATDADGNVYVAGRLSGSAVTLWKFAPDGSPVWESPAPWADDLAVDRSGNVFLSGGFGGTMTVGETVLTSNGYTDFYIARFDASGHAAWAVSGGGAADDRAQGLAVDTGGTPVAVADFRESFEFSGVEVTSDGKQDILLFRLELTP